MSLQHNYNKSGTERKALVQAVSEISGQPAVYQGAPTFAYAVGGYTIDINGVLTVSDGTAPEETARLVDGLQERGYIPESNGDTPAENTAGDTFEGSADKGDSDSVETADNADEENTLTIEIPKAGFTDTALENLHKIIASKESLLKRALGTDKIPVIDTGETLRFPWFNLDGLNGEADAYSRLIAALCKMAKERKRVTARERDTENDRFSMRLFLVQLGFIGDGYKAARKILLKNLTGNSSWKSGHAPERPAASEDAVSKADEPGNAPAEMERGETDDGQQ